jgi:hypothetical protein
LGERLNGIQEVVGSIPIGSTNSSYVVEISKNALISTLDSEIVVHKAGAQASESVPLGFAVDHRPTRL